MSGVCLRRDVLMAAIAASCLPRTFADSVTPPITAVAFSPDGKSIVIGSQAGVSLRDSNGGEETGRLLTEIENVHDLRFSPDHKVLAVAGGTPGEMGVVEFWDWPGGSRRQRLEFHRDVIYAIDFSPDGSKWVVASGDEVCTVIETGSDQPQARFSKHSRAVLATLFLRDSKTIVSASRDQTLRVWDADTGESVRTLHNHSHDVSALAAKPDPDGLEMIASASADRTVRFWQPTIGRMVRFIRLPSQPLCIAWSAGGEALIAGCRDGKARIIDPLNVKLIGTHDLSGGWLYCVAVDPSNQSRAVFGSSDGQLKWVQM